LQLFIYDLLFEKFFKTGSIKKFLLFLKVLLGDIDQAKPFISKE